MSDYVKVREAWHIKEKDGIYKHRKGAVLMCTGAVISGLQESKGRKGDDAPICKYCLSNPLSDEMKQKINRSR